MFLCRIKNLYCKKSQQVMQVKTFLFLASLMASMMFISFYTLGMQNEDKSVQEVTDMQCGFTAHFSNFLKNKGYDSYSFDRPDLKCGAFGGKQNAKETLNKIPVIFIHGNSDIGFGRGTADGYVSWQTGFRSLATYLSGQGYKKSQMYTTTWGPADPNQASNNYHSKQIVLRIRAFVQAVIAYTGATKVNIISHSMGVTIGRQVIKGGASIDHVAGAYEVGASLKNKVNSFIGLAGANLGLTACWSSTVFPTCNVKDGFFPGATSFSGPSTYLNALNKGGGAQGDKVYTIWSKYDDLILLECLVWGKVTCRIPEQTDQVIKTTPQWGHFAVRDNTGPDLVKWLN